MTRIVSVLMALTISLAMLTSCGEQKQAGENEAEKVGTAVLFSDYTESFGKSLEEVEEDVGKLEKLDGWLGVLWYRLTEDEMLGFTYDNDEMILVSAYVPLGKIYPQLAGRTLTKSELDEYLGTETEFVPLFDESEAVSPYLTYRYDTLKVSVFCDENGNVDENSDCMFVQVGE